MDRSPVLKRIDDRPTLVLGGTGHFGRYIVASLLAKNKPVRVLSRTPEKARILLGNRPEIIRGDITSRESLFPALDYIRAIVISVSAMSWQLIRKLELIERDSILMLLEEAQSRGISRVVYISAYDIVEDIVSQLPRLFQTIPRIKQEVETALSQSQFNWTVLGAPPSMKIFFAMIRGDRMMVPGGGPHALPTVSAQDVGEIAAQSVLRDDLSGRRIRMPGPEALSFPEAARRISAVWKKEITFRKIPLLPLQIASLVTLPFNPFLRHLAGSVKLLNLFPQDIAREADRDHRFLREIFSYTPVTLEVEAARRNLAQKSEAINDHAE